MKTLHLFLCVTITLLLTPFVTLASSIDYRGNQSADYIRTLSRNAALDAADIVLYNPAGTAMLDDGFHTNIGVQFLAKEYTMETDGDKYTSDEPSNGVPNFYGVLKSGDWAFFGGLHIPAGGGSVTFDDGIALMSSAATETAIGYLIDQANSLALGTTTATYGSGNMESSSLYYGLTLGTAFQLSDSFSISFSGRMIQATKTFTGKASYDLSISPNPYVGEIDAKQNASGMGYIIGVDFKPSDGFNLGVRYESKTVLDFKADTSKNDFGALSQLSHLNDGETQRKDLPAVLGLGVAVNLTEDFMATLSYAYFFIKEADAGDDDGYDKDYENGYDASFSLEYQFTTSMLLSFGYMYSDTGASKDTVNDFDMTLDNSNYAFGVKYGLTEDFDISLGYIISQYTELKDADNYATYKKSVNTLGVGTNIKF